MTDRFASLLSQAGQGIGTDWISAEELMSFCNYVVRNGYGIQLMEAVPTLRSTERRNHGFEIQGLDGPEAWDKHRDRAKSVALVRAKIGSARELGGEFVYKVWVQRP